ncbi:hypothetical protein [Bradyrhizobium sp.]|uniref:hypothetical protein n=1 Tax=Bradyrhizobium sp. TaxID=376 RepID=UPI003C593D8C
MPHISYWIAYGIPTVILLVALVYGASRAGSFTRRERRELDANARMAERRDDPLKH